MRAQGFTMLELLLVIGIFAVLTAAVAPQLVAFQRSVKLEGAARDIVSALRLAHDRAVLGEDGDANGAGDAWGIRFTNGASDLYETFFGLSYNAGNVKETVYLPGGISFAAPAEGNSADIIFTKLTGTTSAETTLSVTDNTQTRDAIIYPSGRIYGN